MNIKIIKTKDGSQSLYLPDLNETYHSVFGAITESEHVYIEAGYKSLTKQKINILEIGFGTGLNVFLTCLAAKNNDKKIYYETLEKHPLPQDIILKLNNFEKEIHQILFERIHQAPWQKAVNITPQITLHKIQTDLLYYKTNKLFDLIYFDAFAPDKQPELWTAEIFEKMYDFLNPDGILVTYSAKGQVRRNMLAAGFMVERLPGPPGKREMLRAIKKT